MPYKLLDAAQDRWRTFSGAELVKELRDGPGAFRGYFSRGAAIAAWAAATRAIGKRNGEQLT
jgi:hypothetical protein